MRTTDLALPAGFWIIPLSCSRFRADQSNPFHARPLRSSVKQSSPNGVIYLVFIWLHGLNSFSAAIPFLHYRHPMTACILHGSFLRLIASGFIPIDFGVERSMTVVDAEIRIDVFAPTWAIAPAGAASGYDPDGRRRLVGRRKTQGSANQIHATI